ncbi:hypothetical protein H5410_038016 [Solanum commersonii]|uniref:Uncharacterized protein n=1 Tax=Solanum commersonii TaxID=4109 RepID=A0A9J5YB47_SOLCO|nr:hypothetical protein H5410_038016 [Solanum commersonii]
MKWRLTSSVFYDVNVMARLKGVVLYSDGSGVGDAWRMCKHIKRNKNKNKDIRNKVVVAPVEDKMQKVELGWFWHVKRRCVDSLVRRFERLVIAGLRKGRYMPKKIRVSKR